MIHIETLAKAFCKVQNIDPNAESVSITGKIFPKDTKFKLWEYQAEIINKAFDIYNINEISVQLVKGKRGKPISDDTPFE